MPAVLERPTTRAAGWSRRIASFTVVLFAMAGLGHRFGLIDTVSFFWLLGLVGTLAGAALFCAAFGFMRLWERGDRGGRDSAAGAIIALAILSPFLFSSWQLVTRPSLTDISTDVVNPPPMPLAAAQRAGAENAIEQVRPEDAELQLAYYPGATGRRYEVAPDLVMQAIARLAGERGWTMRGVPTLAEGESEAVVEMTAYTTIFAFPVDVAVRVIDEDTAIYVDMRSVSRWGKHDLGDNARRIESFLAALDAAVKTDPVAQ